MGLTKSETEVIALFQKGDKQAFDQLYDTYAPMLLGAISRVVPDPKLAAQVFQQSFIYIWQNRTSYNPEKERFFIWMNKCALNIAVSIANGLEKETNNPKSENQDTDFYVSNKNS